MSVHIGVLELNRLKFRDGLTELFALLCIAERAIVGALCHADGQGCDRNTSSVENLQAVGEALAFLA